MLLLIAGMLLFIVAHLVPTQPELRAGLAARWGERPLKGVIALLSLAGLALVVIGWMKLGAHPGKNPVLWVPPVWTRHIAMALMLPAFILLVAAYIPSRIRTAVKHPMLAAVKLWALAHLLANGDLASLVLFGGFLAFAIYDRISVKRRGSGPVPGSTSGMNDVVVVALGTGLYLLMLFWGHEALFGASPLGP